MPSLKYLTSDFFTVIGILFFAVISNSESANSVINFYIFHDFLVNYSHNKKFRNLVFKININIFTSVLFLRYIFFRLLVLILSFLVNVSFS